MRRPRTRNAGLVRLLQLYATLHGRRWWTVAELAAHFKVTTRTVWRDLNVIDEYVGGLRVKRAPRRRGPTRFRVRT